MNIGRAFINKYCYSIIMLDMARDGYITNIFQVKKSGSGEVKEIEQRKN